MRILVTGGGGFLGSALLRRVRPDDEVICLDHGRYYDRLRNDRTHNVTFLTGDLCDTYLVAQAMEGVNALVHLAGVAGERRCTADPLKSMLSNVYATHVLLAAAQRAGVLQIIYASSYWVYSTFTPRTLPIEEDSQLLTDSVYGAQKVASERMIADSGIAHSLLRISALYGCGTGVGSEREGLLGRFLLAALNGKPLEIYGDGTQRIDLISVEDVARVIVNLLARPPAASGAYNLGGGAAVSILEVAQTVERVLRKQRGLIPMLEFRPAPPGKVWPDKWLAISKIQDVIAGYPFTPLEEGITDTLQALEKVAHL